MNTLSTSETIPLALQTSTHRLLKSENNAANRTGEEKIKRLGEIKKACGDVESVFVASLVKAMRQTIPSGGFMAKAAGSDIYESMIEQQLSQYLSKGVGLGLGQTVFNQMIIKEKLEDTADAQQKNTGGYARTIPVDLLPVDGLRESAAKSPGISLKRVISSDQDEALQDASMTLKTTDDAEDTGQFTGGLLP
jgi:flagellar protein FlgJ